jgi:hypothetical protein
MKKTFLIVVTLVALAVLTTNTIQAQSYSTAIGLRLGYPLSVSVKHFVSDKNAIEGFAGFRSYSGYSWTNVGGLYQMHSPISGLEGLKWYWGAGASVYFWSYKNGFAFGDSGKTSLALLGNLGLDYKFESTPLNVSLDWVPAYFVNGYSSGFGGGYGALSVRYVLN